MDPIFNTKEYIRTKQKEKLKNIPFKKDKDSCILENLKPYLNKSKVVMIYNPLNEEPDLLNLHFYFKDITFVYPKVICKERKQLVYVDWNSNHSKDLNHLVGVTPESIDIFILPALGYNENGTRLGRGGGYFDRSLTNVYKKKIIGVSYREFFPISFPIEAHDLKVGTVITESESFFMLDDFSSPDTI
jgi:5-formyltetrahydrofolate cyclo-ligase